MRLLISALMFFTLVACVKKREEAFVQGQGKDLLQISDYDGAEFEVETLERIMDFKENPAISKSESITHNKDTNIAKMAAVKVNTKADLLGDVPFIAIPNTKTGYKVRYMINKDYLVVLKVADKDLVHPKEAAGAMKLEGGKIGVPLVGYPVRGFYNPENVEQNGSKSNKLIEMPANDKAGSRYFKIDKNARTIYNLQEKYDLFSKEYFAGKDGKSEWFFSQTIIAAGGRYKDYSGWVLAQQDAQLNALSKVKFTFNRNEMRAISVNVDSRIDNKEEINQTVLVKMPIEWKEYRPTPSGTQSFMMNEEENNSVDWEKRSYVKLDFARASTITISSPNFRFVDLEVDKDYMSFTLFDTDNNLRIKHSFLRDSGRKKYTPKRLLKEDFEKFGFFDTQKHEINNYEKYLQEDYGKNVFINRFNVAERELKFYFTEGSDEKLIPAAAKAADEWSDAFRKAGVALKIVAVTDPKQRKRLGDIRYNQINLIRSSEESNLFGYGPSITDPRTGEIISATTNMHITSIVSALVSHIRDYMMYQSGQTKSLSIFANPTTLSDAVTMKGDKVVMKSGTKESQFLKKFPFVEANGQVTMKTVELPERDQGSDKDSKLRTNKNFGREFDISITGKNLNKDIEKMCPEIKTAIAAMKDGGRSDKENEIVIGCAEKLVPGKMFGTLLHEMGHNFGLRHNFYGSVDAVNFLSKDETGTDEQVNSSSVMEYPSFGEDRLTKVGRYDVAAIRYGYGDAVETKEGKILKLDTSKTIVQNLKQNNVEDKKFLFCTDEDVAVGTDPMCARHDAGTTPDQIISHIISEYNSTIADYNYRLGRQRGIDPARLTNYRIRRFWVPMKRFYDEWRYRLNDHLGIGNEYLESFDAAKLEQSIAEKVKGCNIEKDPSSAECRFSQYRNAADKVFKFAMQMATLPPKYCIGQRNGQLASVEFADVRRIIMAVNKFVPESCTNDTVKAYIKEKYSFVPEAESGYELEDVRLDMKVKMSKTQTDYWGNPLPEPPDVIGLMPEKMIAVEILAVRTALSMSSADKQFLPNFLDEPKYREATLAYLADRVSKGISAQKLLSTSNKKWDATATPFFEKYKYEKRYIDNMVSTVFYGLDVPEKTMATKQRKRKFSVKYTDKKDILEKAKYKVAGLDGTTFYAIMNDEATEAKKLLQILETLPKRLEAASPLNESTFLGLIDLAKNNLGAEDQGVDIAKFLEFFYLLIEDEIPESLGTARTQDQKNMDKFRFHWKKVFQKETNAVRELFIEFNQETTDRGNPLSAIPSYSSDIAAYKDPKSKDFGKGFTPGKYDKVAEILFAPGYALNQKTVIQRIEEYKKVAVKSTQDEKSEDVHNYEELSTQMDMILGVLRSMTEY